MESVVGVIASGATGMGPTSPAPAQCSALMCFTAKPSKPWRSMASAGLHQSQMTAWQFDAGFARQRAVPTQAFGQAAFEQLCMAHGANPIGQYPGKRQVRLITRQPQGQRTKGLRHGGAINHTQDRHAKMPRQIGAGRGAVKQPHHTFNQNQIRLTGGFPQQTTTFLGAHHPQVHLIHRRPAGALQDHGVEKVRTALEHPHLASLIAMQPGQSSSNRGLALTGSRRGDQNRRTMT